MWRWANLPLPDAHVVGILIGMLLHIVLKIKLLPKAWMGLGLGGPLILIGLILALWAVREAGLVELEEPASLITSGPYAFSRNPMYLAWSILYAGLGLAVNSALILVLLPPVVVFTHFVGVLKEERSLEASFGEEYRRYRRRVRRYL